MVYKYVPCILSGSGPPGPIGPLGGEFFALLKECHKNNLYPAISLGAGPQGKPGRYIIVTVYLNYP